MKRSTRPIIFLFAIVVLLGAAVTVQLQRERRLSNDPLTQIDIHAVRAVAVSCNGCKARRFEKVNDHWQMREPYALPADDAKVARLIAIAVAPVRFRHRVGDLDAGKLGLDPPQATLSLDGVTISFGNTDAIHGNRYVEVGGVIALVPDRFSALLFAAPENQLATQPVE